MNRLHARPQNIRRSLLATAVACCFAPVLAQANPTGPTVVNGQASFATQGKSLTVTNTPGAIIHWQGFSVGVGELTRFVQQNAASAVLNRVVGGNPSAILGTLQSNGRVFLINPNGIMFGAGAVINTAGLVASTLNMVDADFLAGRMRFVNTPGAGLVRNEGEIRTPLGGRVMLVSPTGVENAGIIHAPKGEVILAAGKSVEIADSLNPEVRVEIAAPEARAVNLGKIIADSGKVGIYGSIVGNRGLVSADSAVVGENGRIVFKASRDATLEAGSVTTASGARGGEIDVSAGGTTLVAGEVKATGSAEAGGQVKILGDRVGLIDKAAIDVSGERGGGSALVGGDLQGANAAVQNAQVTYFGPNASIKADALGEGSGGKVIVWADDTTRSHGTISARGGARSGDGGFVETSGKRHLDVTRGPDVRAPAGRNGTWLLDPNDIEIVAGNAEPINNSGFPFFAPTGDSSVVGNELINAQLDFGSNVVINTTSKGDIAGTQDGNITVSAPITKTAATVQGGPIIGTTSLTLQAHNDIVIAPGATITSTGDPLNVTMTANIDATGGGGVTMGGAITTNGGSVAISGADLIAINAPINTIPAASTFGGSVQLTSTANGVSVGAPVTGGFFSASGASGTTIAAPVSATSSFQATSSAGTVTIASSVTSTSSATLTGNKGVTVAPGATIATGQFSTFSATVTDAASASVLSTGAGSSITAASATLTADNMDIQGGVSTGAGSITVRQNLAGRALTLGGETAGTLSLTQAELNNLQTSGSFTLGNSSTGAVTFAGPVTAALPSSVSVNSGTSITANAGVNVSGSLFVNAPTITVGAPVSSAAVSSVNITADNLTLNSTVSSGGNIDVGTRSGGRAISLGVAAPSGNALELTAAQLNNLIAPARLRFNTSGPITIAGSIAPTGTNTLSLASSSNTVTEAAGAAVTVQNLALSGRTLIDFQQDNDVTNLAAQITCCAAGNINFVSKPGKAVNVGTVDFVNGVTVTNFSGTANVVLQADDMNIANTVRANIGDVKLMPRSAATAVTLGADAGGTLGLTSSELGFVQGSKLTIAGDRMDIAAPVSFAAATTTLAPFTANRPLSIVSGSKSAPGELQFLDTEFANLIGGSVVIGGPSAGPLAVNAAVGVPSSVGTLTLHSADATSGITVAPGAAISSPNSVGLTTDVLTLGAGVSSGAGSVSIATNTAARNIDLGADPGTTLGLGAGELALLSAPAGTLGFTTAGGSIAVTGAVGFAGGSINALALDAGAAVTVNTSSSLTVPVATSLRAPTITINGPVAATDVVLRGNAIGVGSTVTASVGGVNVMPRDFRSIDLGGADTGATLGLTNAELNNLSPTGVLRIGEVNEGVTGNINVSAPLVLPGGRMLSLKTSSGNVTQTAGATITIPSGKLAVEASDRITLTQPNAVDTVALRSWFDEVSFVRAPGGGPSAPLAVGSTDGLSGVYAGFYSSQMPVTLTADQININDPISGSSVTLLPTAGGTIDIGTKSGGAFGFTQAELDRVFAGAVTVGTNTSGNITVSQPVSVSTFSDLTLFTQGMPGVITVAPGANLSVPGNLTTRSGTLATGAALTSDFGAVNLNADQVTLGGMVSSGGGAINIRPLSTSTVIDIGGPDSTSPTLALGLDATDLGNLAYNGGTLSIIGSAATNHMNVNFAGGLPDNVSLQSGGAVTVNASTFSVGGNLSITANSMSIPGVAGIAAGTGVNINAGAGRNITLGTKPGTGLDLDTGELAKISIGAGGTLAFDTAATLTTTAALPFDTLVPDTNVRLSAGTLVHTGGALSAQHEVALRGDSIPSAGFSPVSSAGGGRVSVAPRTLRSMNAGANPGGSVLGFLSAQIDQLSTSGVVQLGDSATTNALTVGAAITQPAGSSALALVSSSTMSQAAGATISASNLRLTSTNSSVNLPQDNAVGTLAGSSPGSFTFTGTGTLTIGTVDGQSGVGSSTVTLRADSLNIADTVGTGLGSVTLAPRSTGAPVAIDLGGDTGFGLTAAEIGRIAAGVLTIGSTNPTGSIDVNAAIDLPGSNLNLTTMPGGTINVKAPLGTGGTSAVTMNAGAGGTINVQAPVGSSVANNVTLTTGAGGTAIVNGALTAYDSIVVTADAISTSQPMTATSEFSQVTLTNPGSNGYINIGGAISAGYDGVTATGRTINVNAPIVAVLDYFGTTYGNVTLRAATGTTGSSVTVNQPITAGQSISIQTDSLALNAALATLGSTVTLQPLTAGTPISLGTETAGAFSLTSGELALITADQLTIGNSAAGPMTVNAPVSVAGLETLILRSSGDITQLATAPITVSTTSDTGFLTGALHVFAGGEIVLNTAENNISSSLTGSAGTGKLFLVKNSSFLKLQNLASTISVQAPSSSSLGKTEFPGPEGFTFAPGGSPQNEILVSVLGTVLQAGETQEKADKKADEKKEEANKKQEEDEKKQGIKACS